jgi:hypothetical protein
MRAHLARAEPLGERSGVATTEAESKGTVLRQLLHTMAATEEAMIAGGKTRAEVRASRPPLPTTRRKK